MRRLPYVLLLVGLFECAPGGTSGGGTAGGGTSGGSTAGGSTAGGSTAGGSTAGGSTAGGGTAGGGTSGGGTAGGGPAPDGGFTCPADAGTSGFNVCVPPTCAQTDTEFCRAQQGANCGMV